MERLHLHTIQQLQHELADARERSGTFTDDSCVSQKNSKDASQFSANNENQLDANRVALSANTSILPNGNSDNAESFASSGNASTQVGLSSWLLFCFILFSRCHCAASAIVESFNINYPGRIEFCYFAIGFFSGVHTFPEN